MRTFLGNGGNELKDYILGAPRNREMRGFSEVCLTVNSHPTGHVISAATKVRISRGKCMGIMSHPFKVAAHHNMFTNNSIIRHPRAMILTVGTTGRITRNVTRCISTVGLLRRTGHVRGRNAYS